MDRPGYLLDYCLNCNACQSACPVARHDHRYPGPKYAGPVLARLLQAGAAPPSVDFCSNCMRCELACPHQVPVARLIAAVKDASPKRKTNYLRDLFLSYPHLWGACGTALSPFVNRLMAAGPGHRLLGRVLSLDADRPLLGYASKSFVRQSRGWRAAGKREVVYFAGCYCNYNNPAIGHALTQILEMLDIGVIVPEQRCCGMPLMANGFRPRARQVFKKNISRLLPYVQEGYDIVCTCPTCALALKKIYPEQVESDEARKVARRTYDFAEYLAPHEQRLTAIFRRLSLKLSYHLPCHTLVQGIGAPSLSLLRLIPGIVVEFAEGCCGQSGTFGFKKEKSALADQIGESVFAQILAGHPDLVVTDCGSCAHQIAYRCKLTVKHSLQILQDAIGI